MVRNRLSAAVGFALVVLFFLPAAAPASTQLNPIWTLGSTLGLPESVTLRDVSVRGPADVWAVGRSPSRPLVVNWTATGWAEVVAPFAVELMAIDAVPSSGVWLVGTGVGRFGLTVPLLARYDGLSWQTLPVPLPLMASGLLADVDMLAGGADGWAVGSATDHGFTKPLIMRAVEGLWQPVQLPPLASPAALHSVYATEGQDVWAAGTRWDELGVPSALVLHWDGTIWKQEQLPLPVSGPGWHHQLAAVAGDGFRVWAVGEICASAIEPVCQAMVVSRDEQGWRLIPTDGPIGTKLWGVLVLGPSDVWVVGYALSAAGMKTEHLEHWDGTGFWKVDPRTTFPRDFPAAGLLSVGRLPGTGELWAVGWLEHPVSGRPLVLRYQ